jgi:hypothetical protein
MKHRFQWIYVLIVIKENFKDIMLLNFFSLKLNQKRLDDWEKDLESLI